MGDYQIGAGKAPQEAPQEPALEFDPLRTCPEKERRRWKRRAALAASRPMTAIELKCLECSAWDRPEAKRCEISGCSLWCFNRRIFA